MKAKDGPLFKALQRVYRLFWLGLDFNLAYRPAVGVKDCVIKTPGIAIVSRQERLHRLFHGPCELMGRWRVHFNGNPAFQWGDPLLGFPAFLDSGKPKRRPRGLRGRLRRYCKNRLDHFTFIEDRL
jgi:hypothetical protein